MALTREVAVGPVRIGGGQPIALIAGPCVVEGEDHLLGMGEALRDICRRAGVPLILKASFDKANRTSVHSFRGPGLEAGLRALARAREALGVPVLSDVHEVAQVGPAAAALDVLQIPAFLCRQTDLLVAAAKTGKVVNVKKGQFLAPWDARHIVEKLEAAGAAGVLLTERGSSFGFNNLVVDFRGLPLMRAFGAPVAFDVTHSLQLPGGAGAASGGERQFVPHLLRAAAAAGVDAIFMEVHPDPDRAPCDGPNMVPLADLPDLLRQLTEVARAAAPYTERPLAGPSGAPRA
jgi:2-dehydro-3-deoxyphosphooctonate aldolase (KDO 8-P synthase)